MRCKRCGTPIQALDHLCQGCGKSIIALREDNEIIYNDEELSQVEIEKMNKKETPIKQEVIEEKNDSLDIFGDAIFNNEIEEVNTNEKEQNNEFTNTNEIVIDNNDIETIDIIEEQPLETINMEKLSEKKEIVEEPVEIIEDNKEIIEPKKNKKSKLTLIIVAIAFILLIIAGIFLFFYSKTSPAIIFDYVINKINLSQSNNIKNEITLSIEMPSKDNQLLQIINDLDFNIISQIDNEKVYVKLNPLYKNKTLINADVYLNNEEINLYLNGIYDKYINIKNTDEIIFDSNKIKYLNIFIEEWKKEVKKSLNSKYLIRSIEKINDEYNTKSTFKIDNTNYEELLNNLKNNQELVKALMNLNELTEAEAKLNIEQTLKDIENLEIILYTEILKNELSKIEINLKNSATNSNLVINVNNDIYDFIYKDLNTSEENKGTLKIETKDSKNNYIIKLDDITINMSTKTTYNENLVWPNESNKILITEITEEDGNNIMTNLMSSEGINEIMNIFGPLFGNNNEEPNEEEIEDDFLEE